MSIKTTSGLLCGIFLSASSALGWTPSILIFLSFDNARVKTTQKDESSSTKETVVITILWSGFILASLYREPKRVSARSDLDDTRGALFDATNVRPTMSSYADARPKNVPR